MSAQTEEERVLTLAAQLEALLDKLAAAGGDIGVPSASSCTGHDGKLQITAPPCHWHGIPAEVGFSLNFLSMSRGFCCGQ